MICSPAHVQSECGTLAGAKVKNRLKKLKASQKTLEASNRLIRVRLWLDYGDPSSLPNDSELLKAQ